jgi:hypothetical protein
VDEVIVGPARWEVELRVFDRGGNYRCVINNAIDVDQGAVIRVGDGTRPRVRGWERSIGRPWDDDPIRTKVHESGLEQKRPICLTRRGARGTASVPQLFGEVHAKALQEALRKADSMWRLQRELAEVREVAGFVLHEGDQLGRADQCARRCSVM